eukprot:SAG11_NODE_2185_length_3711_cov_1.448228_3_plen_66_part_00
MAELTAHTTDGLDWVGKNSGGVAEANAMVLSAWNEHDDKYGGAEKLQNIKKAIDAAQAQARELLG